uniref:RanBP-type and C3HC4-type zinc finger-containing protein 1 n=1 Tax=Peronospora matthiolae TaxID=2874970 RepID=A0AAV1TG89_9STRA
MPATTWSCSRCTFENEVRARQCAMCWSDWVPEQSNASPLAVVSDHGKLKEEKTEETVQSPSVLLYGVGSSAEKEQQRVQKKLQQLKDLGIELPEDEMLTWLQRNCFSVSGAASAYFERKEQREAVARADPKDDEMTQRLEKLMEMMDREMEDVEVLGKTTMQALVTRPGVQLCAGEGLLLQAENAGKKRMRPGLSSPCAVSGIVRVATLQRTQIGRLERNMELLLHPLMKSGLVKLAGVCEVLPVSSRMFASFDVLVFVCIKRSAFDVFTEGNPNFHLSDHLYELLQKFDGSVAPSPDAKVSQSISGPDGQSSQVNPEDLDTLFSECGEKELHRAAERLEEDPSEHLVEYLNEIKLRDHQKQALRWMLWREDQLREGACEQQIDDLMWKERRFRSQSTYFVNPFEKSASLTRPRPPAPCLGGILADDMGMGKTMMMLSLIAYQKHVGGKTLSDDDLPSERSRKATGGTLVVCPLSLLHQWKNEALERFRPDTLSVCLHYGDDRDTNTGLAISRFSKSDIVLTTYGVLSAEFSRNGPVMTTTWNRVILDEAHSIKNRSAGYFKTCSALKATHRWCLTGTPIQNTLDDMFSLLCFLKYQPWSRIAWWKRVIIKPYEDGKDVNTLSRLKAILTPILLRRTKRSRDKQGNMIVKLPPKHVELVKLEFSPDERAFYQAVYDRSRAEFNGFVASGTAATSYVAIFALLLRLHQACDHPLLALGKDFEQALKSDAKHTGATAAAHVKPAFQPQPNESSKAYYLRIAAHLQKSMQASNHPQLLQDERDGSASEAIMTGGLTASYIQNVMAQVEDDLDSQECPICLDPPRDAVLTPCAHVLCGQCLRDSLANDPEDGCPVCRTVVDVARVYKLPPPSASRTQDNEDVQDSSPLNKTTHANAVVSATRVNNNSAGFESAKLQQLLRDLTQIKLENRSATSPKKKRKVVVFSQWTSMLDMVSQLLSRHGFSHCTFNGGLNREARERVLTKFATDPDVEILVISLRAGGVGLNLTCASVVILLDPWWNPGVEEQAIDRVHRLGQTQDVQVKRYVVTDTVEDMILQLQQRKQRLATRVLVVAKACDEQRSERLNLDDLRRFFR